MRDDLLQLLIIHFELIKKHLDNMDDNFFNYGSKASCQLEMDQVSDMLPSKCKLKEAVFG